MNLFFRKVYPKTVEQYLYVISFFCIASVFFKPVFAQGVSPFEVNSDGLLKVKWDGRELISCDMINYMGKDGLKDVSGFKEQTIDSVQIQNIWFKEKHTRAITGRREVAVDGNVLEIIMQYEVPAYRLTKQAGTIMYSVCIPLSALDGFSYKAYAKRPHRREIATGVITKDLPNGSLGPWRFGAYIAFEKGDKRIAFDFNPSGPSAFNEYGPVLLVGQWYVNVSDGFLKFIFAGTGRISGGICNSILRVISGATFEDYKKFHPLINYQYFDYIPAIIDLDFGPGRLFGLKALSKGEKIKSKTDDKAGQLHSCVSGCGKAELPLKLPEVGLYVFTLRTAGKTGPFTVSINDRKVAETSGIDEDQCQIITIPYYAKKNELTMSFSGQWKINSLAVQPLIYKGEDFTFTRRLWRVKGIPTPSDFYCSPVESTDFKSDIQVIPWSQKEPSIAKVKNISFKEPPISVQASDDPDLLWRWKARIGGLGQGNNASLHEYENPADLSRRLDEVKAQGFNVLLVNGLMFRHLWPDQRERVQATLKNIVDQAHKRGMKVVDHQDLTVLLNVDAGLASMCKNISWTLRDVRNGQVTRGWCLNNPEFRKQYFAYITDHIRKTNIDALMLDEVAFHCDYFCGCEHCRKKFHQMTGLDMPADENNPVYKDGRHHLWRLWLEFRARTVGDFRVAMHEAIKKVKPDFVLINYTTHEGFLTNYGFRRPAGDITHTARSAGIIGTEIMSRNVFECYRRVFACRNIKNALRWAYGAPIFGLIYHLERLPFAYTGWAMNNMHGQTSWLPTSSEELAKDAARYVNWADNMQAWRAEPQSDIAVIFSRSSRNHPRVSPHHDEVLGICEILDDLHIQNTVLLNLGLTVEKLKKYKLVILPNSGCMSDSDLKVIKQYIEQGGNVLAISNVGFYDELGLPKKKWELGDWLGIEPVGKLPVRGGRWVGTDFKTAVFRIKVKDKATRVECVLDVKGKTYPAVVRRRIGKGTLTYCAVRIGSENVQGVEKIRKKWKWVPNPHIRKLIQSIIKMAIRKPLAFTCDSDPELRIKVWKYSDKPVWMVHVLNCTGASMRKGQTVPVVPPTEPYPELKKDVVFNIDIGGGIDRSKIKAYWTSPDSLKNGRVPLKTDFKGNDILTVRIPKSLVKAYGIVYITAEE